MSASKKTVLSFLLCERCLQNLNLEERHFKVMSQLVVDKGTKMMMMVHKDLL